MSFLKIEYFVRGAAVVALLLALMAACSGCTRSDHHDSVEEIGYVYAAVREYRNANQNPTYAGFVAWMDERGRD